MTCSKVKAARPPRTGPWESPGDYQVYAAREGNVIVARRVLRRLGRPNSVTLSTLLDRALGPDWSRQCQVGGVLVDVGDGPC